MRKKKEGRKCRRMKSDSLCILNFGLNFNWNKVEIFFPFSSGGWSPVTLYTYIRFSIVVPNYTFQPRNYPKKLSMIMFLILMDYIRVHGNGVDVVLLGLVIIHGPTQVGFLLKSSKVDNDFYQII